MAKKTKAALPKQAAYVPQSITGRIVEKGIMMPASAIKENMFIILPQDKSGMKFNTYGKKGEPFKVHKLIHEMAILEHPTTGNRFSINTNHYSELEVVTVKERSK